MNIENAIALVTGANRGVGREYVIQLLEAGVAKIYAGARDTRKLNDVVALDSSRVIPIELDVTKVDQVRNAAREARDVTLLINNAGSLTFGGALEVSADGLSKDMAVNYTGLLEMTRAFTPVIEANGGGAVVNMLSLLSFVSAPGFSGYNGSKAAAWSMAMSLRAYLGAKGITVINAFPAGIDTDMLAGVEAAKDSPVDVVHDILAAVAADREDVYPASAAGVFEAWRQDQKAIEAAFAEMR